MAILYTSRVIRASRKFVRGLVAVMAGLFAVMLINLVLSLFGFNTGLRDGEALKWLRSIRVLDPACGSGAFLVHALERIASMRLECGEDAPIAEVRRRVLMTSIFGVDLNPTAVWLCELRLWLSIVIESADGDPVHLPRHPG